MISGDIKKVDLSTSPFRCVITEGNFYVDKTRMIDSFLEHGRSVHLVTRQRRLGKSLNLDMLHCFLTDKEDLRHLFKGLRPDTYKQKIYSKIREYIELYCNNTTLAWDVKNYIGNEKFNDTDALLYLFESVYKATGKRAYLLIDEYDKMLMDNHDSILCANKHINCKPPLSNRESGEGRYDVFVELPKANFIFEFKIAKTVESLTNQAQNALNQIEIKRYGADIDSNKKLIKVGVAFHGKMCKVICGE
jgi:hypothetical protein